MDTFGAPVGAVHHFLGKYVAWVVVALHVAAALFHHGVRRDNVLTRMLPSRSHRQAGRLVAPVLARRATVIICNSYEPTLHAFSRHVGAPAGDPSP